MRYISNTYCHTSTTYGPKLGPQIITHQNPAGLPIIHRYSAQLNEASIDDSH